MNSRVLQFGDRKVLPDIRKLSDMKAVVFDYNWLKTAQERDLYYMYRDLYLSDSDHSIIIENHLRYDITIIPPLKLGKEFVKTAGHYHPLIKGSKYTYPEVYEVLEGVAHYLMQTYKTVPDKVHDAVIIQAKKGDKVIVPPNYGHVTINPSDQELLMANWVSRDFSSIYEPYKKLEGAAYFELTSATLIPNKKYDDLPEIRHLKPTNFSQVGLYKDEGIYNLINDIELLEYLNNPEKFEWLWEMVLKNC